MMEKYSVVNNKISLHIAAISILFSLSIITYLNCLQNQFVYDDNSTIIENHFIEDWSNFPALFTHDYFTLSGELTYRPIVTLSYFVDYSLWYSHPTGYHITNIVLHSINSILIYILIFHLLDYASKQIASPQRYNNASFINHAFLTSLLFILHPIVNETVNAISYREDLLATNFVLISFLLFLLSYKKPASRVYSTKTKNAPLFYSETTSLAKVKYFIPLYIATMIVYFLALLSKESAIVLPGLIFSFCFIFPEHRKIFPYSSLPARSPDFPLHRYYYTDNNEKYQNIPLKTIYRQNIFRFSFNTFTRISLSPYFLGYIGISIIYLILRFIVFHNIQEQIYYPEKNFMTTFFTSTKIICRYISNIFIPFYLNVDYHVLHIKSPRSISFIISLLFLISVFVIIFRLKSKPTFQPFKYSQYDKKNNLFLKNKFYFILFATLWFFVSLFPVINIIPLCNLMADRYLYLPFIGFCIFFSTLITHQKRILKYSFIIPVFIVCIVITTTKNRHWKNEFTLWYYSSQNPLCSFTTYNNLGTQYSRKDDPDTALKLYHKAIDKSQEIGFTNYAAVHYNMGNAYKKKNLPDKAIPSYIKAIQINQNYKQAHNNLGEIYFDKGQYDKALDEYNTALTIDPNFASAHNNLGVLYNKRGMQERAIAEYEKTLISDSLNSDAYYNLGNIYESQNLFELAENSYQSALAINPSLVYAHNNLGTLYDKKGMWDKAIEEYRLAIKHNPMYSYAHNNLGTSFAKKGDIDNALTEFQEAVSLLPNNPDFHFNLGYIFLRKGNNALALKEFEEIIRVKPSHTEALLHAGIAHYKQGNKDMAVKLWKEVLIIDPNHLKTKKYLEMIEKETL